MNERIKELMRQSMVEYQFDLRFSPEKFAELIVSEFIQQGKLIQSQTVINGSEEYITGREMGIEVFMNQVRQHFGVEVK
jgi:hypothetical protein